MLFVNVFSWFVVKILKRKKIFVHAKKKKKNWFNFPLPLFMSGYKWDKWDLKKSSFKANQPDFTSVNFDVLGKVTIGGHLYPLINKSKKK